MRIIIATALWAWACTPSSSDFTNERPDGLGRICTDVQPCPAELTCHESRCVVPEYTVVDARAYYSEGTVRYRVEVDDPQSALEQVQVVLDGEVVASGGPFETFVAENLDGRGQAFILNAYQVALSRPDELEVTDGDGRLLSRVPVEAQREQPLGARCLRTDPAERCALGSICLPAACDRTCDDVGTCHPITARVWRGDGRIHVDLESDRPITPFEDQAFSIDAELITPELPRLAGNRWAGEWTHWIKGAVALRHRGNLFTPPIEVDDRSSRGLGEACDLAELRDYCAEGACIEGACRVPTAPTIDEVVLVHEGDRFGLLLRGRDPDNDVDSFTVYAGGALQFHSRMGRYSGPWITREVRVSDGTFEWLVTGRSDRIRTGPWGTARVGVLDREGLGDQIEVEPIEDPLVARPLGAAGDACDRAHTVFPCGEGLRCDRRDDQPDAPLACHPEEPTCPAGLAEPLALGVPAQVTDTFAALETFPICVRNVGTNDPRWANYFSFVAPQTGRYRVHVESQSAFAVSVRRGCLLPFSEFACAGFESVSDPPVSTQVEIDLSADEAVAIVITSGHDYRVVVDPL